ncbi:MAG: hypothetical protein F6K63_10705 [Moorea sp. SIO1G6]|uniref:hypothetical protein n=1 Tax=Moorena sp. SIO1G6 TaxID=2607840 RepID=UPI001300F451|nr:hypothetical protein [Moorena sp. SIO1G6]NET64829.1 hypothetical protein [Moorena sp. SIO1G6]
MKRQVFRGKITQEIYRHWRSRFAPMVWLELGLGCDRNRSLYTYQSRSGSVCYSGKR